MRDPRHARSDRRRSSTARAWRLGAAGLALRAGLAAGLAAGLTGCTPWATYPSVEGSVDMSNPELTPIPELMSMAIRETHERDGRDEGIVFNLPPGTPPVVFDRVAFLLGTGRPMEYAGEPAIHVVEVRVRTTDSQVDVIHLNAGGVPEEMTISFRQNLLRGFHVESVRPWRYRVVMPPPHLVRPEAEPAVADEWATDEWNQDASVEVEPEQAVGADDSYRPLPDQP